MEQKKDLKCGLCKRGREVEAECGKLWHDESRKCTAHKKCMQYSAGLIQYKMRRFGGFKVNRVMKEIQRGKRLKCAICFKDKKLKKIAGGATAGCALKKCKKTFHYYCAHRDEEAVTTRIEMTKAEGASVYYCVFCGEEHQSEYFKGLNCKWVAKDTDSEGENNDSHSESESDRSDDGDDDRSGNSSDSRSRTSNRGDKDMDRSKKDFDAGQQQPPSSSGKNGAIGEKSRTEKRDSFSEESDDTVSDIFEDTASHRVFPKLLHDTSGYNISEAAQSLAPPADGGSGAGGNAVVDDADVHHVKAEKWSSLEEGERSGKKRKMDGNLNSAPAYVVCFLEKRDMSDTKTTTILQKCANKVFSVPPDAIFLWQYNGRPLSPGHVIYILNEISKALCHKREEELHRIMFNIQDADISKFDSTIDHNNSLADDIREELYANIRNQISENFEKAEQNYSQCVGKLCLIKPLSTHVGFVLLCHETDSSGVARAQMQGEKPIYIWDRELTLTSYNCHEISSTGSLRQREFEKLHRFLKNVPVSCTHSWPKDSVLRFANEYSVTGRLHQHYLSSLTPGGAHLVFLGPVDQSIMHYGLYIPKRMTVILDELLTAKHEVYCILDVGPEVGLCSLTDIVPKLPPEIEMEAFVANDPKLTYTSCSIIHFSL